MCSPLKGVQQRIFQTLHYWFFVHRQQVEFWPKVAWVRQVCSRQFDDNHYKLWKWTPVSTLHCEAGKSHWGIQRRPQTTLSLTKYFFVQFIMVHDAITPTLFMHTLQNIKSQVKSKYFYSRNTRSYRIHRKDWSPVGLIDPFSLGNSVRYITTSLLTSKQNKVTNVLVLGYISKICAINAINLDIALCLELRQLIWIYDTDTTWGNSTVQSHYKSF